LLEHVSKSEDTLFILHGTSALRSFINIGAKEVKKVSSREAIKACAIRLLQPEIGETAALCLGNFVIQFQAKIDKKNLDTELLYAVVRKV